jgi:hypothetical protein
VTPTYDFANESIPLRATAICLSWLKYFVLCVTDKRINPNKSLKNSLGSSECKHVEENLKWGKIQHWNYWLGINDTECWIRENLTFRYIKQGFHYIHYLFLFSHIQSTESLTLLTGSWLCTSGSRCTACHEAHTNFGDKSECLVANNIWNEGK